jgi:hypothetical protein
MSQNDYIRLLRTRNTLCESASKWSPVLSEEQYTNYSAFTIETSVINSKQVNSELTPTGRTIIYEIDVPTTFGSNSSSQPLFTMCRNTNSRGNRKPLLASQAAVRPIRPVLKTDKVAC